MVARGRRRARRRAFIAASLGWMLDSFDVMLYALVLTALIKIRRSTFPPAMAGALGSITLIAAAVGGIVFGVIADRLGRKQRADDGGARSTPCSRPRAASRSPSSQLAVFRILLGLGMGGEWATGAALVSESFPARHRGKALAFVQSSWAIGYGLAALVNLLVMPLWGWRGVFFVGVLPALFTIWIRRRVEEPEDLAHDAVGRSRSNQHVVRARRRNADCLHHADECLHALRLVGTEQLGAGVPELRAGAGRHRALVVHDVAVRYRDAGRNVGWVCELWLHRGCDRPQTRPTSCF